MPVSPRESDKGRDARQQAAALAASARHAHPQDRVRGASRRRGGPARRQAAGDLDRSDGVAGGRSGAARAARARRRPAVHDRQPVALRGRGAHDRSPRRGGRLPSRASAPRARHPHRIRRRSRLPLPCPRRRLSRSRPPDPWRMHGGRPRREPEPSPSASAGISRSARRATTTRWRPSARLAAAPRTASTSETRRARARTRPRSRWASALLRSLPAQSSGSSSPRTGVSAGFGPTGVRIAVTLP